MKLTDPYFEAEFLGEVSEAGNFTHLGPHIRGAQGLFMYCPCGYANPETAHGLIIGFRNPKGAYIAPANFPDRNREINPRWEMSGTSLEDLTLFPSVAVGGAKECWHGWIRNGEVVPC